MATPNNAPFLFDGFSTLIEFANVPGVAFFEKTVTPPAGARGGPIDLSNMRNQLVRTHWPKSLTTMEKIVATVAYKPSDYILIIGGVASGLFGVVQTVRLIFSDGSEILFYGWMDHFKPNECKEGDQPTAEITIEFANLDPAAEPIEESLPTVAAVI